MKKWTTIGATALLALSLAACGDDNDDKKDAANSDSSQTESTSQNEQSTTDNTVAAPVNVKDVKLSFEDAKATFEKTFSGAKISSVDLDDENGTLTYDFEGFDDAKEYSVEIDDNNKVTKEESEARDKNDSDDYQELKFADYLSPDEAIDKAAEASETNGLTAKSWSLDFERSTAEYKVTFGDTTNNEIEVTLDAKTGDQISVEKDD